VGVGSEFESLCRPRGDGRCDSSAIELLSGGTGAPAEAVACVSMPGDHSTVEQCRPCLSDVGVLMGRVSCVSMFGDHENDPGVTGCE
jgi:hypothetical protein